MRFSVSCQNPHLAACISNSLSGWMNTAALAASQHVGGELVDCLTSLIVGTPVDRMGPKLSDTGQSGIRAIISSCVKAHAPIRLYVMWGGLKHYVDHSRQDIDASELYALMQFYRLCKAIEAIYPPSATLSIYLEDFGVLYEDAGGRDQEVHDRIWAGVDRYCRRFQELVSTTASSFAKCIRFDELCPKEHWAEMSSRADANLVVLHRAWRECQKEGTHAQANAQSILEEISWRGEIPAVMRSHYLKRLDSLYPAENCDAHVDRLLRYFAMVSLYQQTRLYTPVEPSIKFAMYKPSPGIPEERVRERLHMRTLSSHFCSQTMPPWTSLGCFELASNGDAVMKIRSRKLLGSEAVEMLPLAITVSEGDMSMTIQSHVVVRG